MKIMARVAPALILAACATTNEFAAAAGGRPIEDLVQCAALAITDEGFAITDRNEPAGLLNATYAGTADTDGESWLETQIEPDGMGHFRINVRTSDDDIARDAALEIVSECGTGM